MILTYRIPLLIIILSVLPLSYTLGCDCSAKPDLDIKDWNNTELIFLATLTHYKPNFRVNHMTFHIMELIKGTVSKDTVDIYFKPGASHTLIHAITEIKAGQTWIVFATKEQGKNKVHIRLRDTEMSELCALSKPVNAAKLSENAFLHFLYDMKDPQKDGDQQFHNQDEVLIAEGKYTKGIPIGQWKYYSPTGKLQNTGNYEAGKKNGEWKTYKEQENGKHFLKKIELFDQNRIKVINIYNQDEAISYAKEFLDTGSKTSNYILNGILKEELYENEDENYFKVVKYFPSGKKKEEKEFQDNALISHVFFDEEGNEIKRKK